jgi:hypothetical protein
MTTDPPPECHATGCNRLGYQATTCACGFTARLIRGEASVTAANRGKGEGRRYVVDVVGRIPQPENES